MELEPDPNAMNMVRYATYTVKKVEDIVPLVFPSASDYIPDHIFKFKIFKFFDADPGSWMEKIRIRNNIPNS